MEIKPKKNLFTFQIKFNPRVANLIEPGASTPGARRVLGNIWNLDSGRFANKWAATLRVGDLFICQGSLASSPAIRTLDLLLQEDRDRDVEVLQEVENAMPGEETVSLIHPPRT